MANVKFTLQEIDWFNDKISNVLENTKSQQIYMSYVENPHNCSPNMNNAFKLWKAASDTKEYNEAGLLDMMDNVDGFNDDPLLTISECEHKLIYIKQECCRLLEITCPRFIEYLMQHHM